MPGKRGLLVGALIAGAMVLQVAGGVAAVPAAGTISTVAGTSAGFSGDGGKATAAKLNLPSAVARTADGGYLIADAGNSRIRKVSASGVITTVAGNGKSDFSGDGGPATKAALYGPTGVSPVPGGGFLIADTGNKVIRMVSPSGTITTVAGCRCALIGVGDGGQATAAALNNPADVVAISRGGFLIADTANARVRKVANDGVISTVAGTGTGGFSGDGGPATAAKLNAPTGLALLPGGGFLIADSSNNRIREVSAAGVITTVAGVGVSGFSGDGGPAKAARLAHPSGVRAASGGGYYIADSFNGRIRFVSPAEVISTVAGGGTTLATEGDATKARLSQPHSIGVTPAGFLVADPTAYRVVLLKKAGG